MAKSNRKRKKKCLICCMRNRNSSDDEDNFPEIPPTRLDDKVVEEEETEGPTVSRGNIAIESREGIFDPVRPSKTQQRDLHEGDAAMEMASTQPREKIVHFAQCHEEPRAKDTRDKYRHTPVKERPTPPCDFNEEYVLLMSKTMDGCVEIPMTSFKAYVTDYVKKIVESALESVVAGDESHGIDVPDAEKTVDLDDGIEVDCAEEDALISEMVDEMLVRVVQSLACEASEFEITLPRVSKSVDSDLSCSTITGESIATSLEWDGYEPLLLREDPASTDISIQCPEVSAGMDV